MSTSTHSEPCQACRTIDRADGIEDGNLYKVEHYSTRNERSLLRSLQRTQDRVADAITSFAGSLNFVYLHSVWFGVWILLNVGLLGAALEFDKFPFGLLTMIVNGFIEPVTRTLPMEYAVEWSRLIELQMEGSVG